MRKVCALCLILTLSCLLPGCWDRTEVEDTAYVASIGIDKAEDEYLWTFRLVDPLQLPLGMLTSLPPRGGLASGTITVRATSLQQAVQLLQASIMRILSLDHVRWIGISEEVAREGLLSLMEQLLRHNQMRRTANLYIVRGKAWEAFNANRPVGDVNPLKFFEGIKLVSKRMHLSPPVTLQHLFSRFSSTGVDAYVSAMGVNAMAQQPPGSDLPPMKDRSLKGGDFPRIGGNPVEFAGTAVLSGDRLVGILTVDETVALLSLRGEMGKSYSSAPNPLLPGTFLAFRYHQENKPQYRLTFVGGEPVVRVKIQLEGEILSAPGSLDYTAPQQRRKVEQGVARYLEETVYAPLVKKLYQEWGSDPVGFGQLARSRFATYEDWLAYRWTDHIKHVQVDVAVELYIRRFGLLLGSGPAPK